MIRLAFSLLLAASALAAPPAPVTAMLENASRPTACAEEDNVHVTLSSPEVRAFHVTLRHPPYVREIAADSAAPDRSGCASADAPSGPGAPRLVRLHEDDDIRILGLAFRESRRPATVPVRIGDRTADGLHQVQVYRIVRGVPVEFLVVHPPDGHWRARPLPPPHLSDSAYGSSFLVGPVEMEGRPLVDLAAIRYVPGTRTFELAFRRGGTATVAIDRIDEEGLDLAVALDAAIAGRPFAALHSMFVAPDRADIAEATWTARDGTVASAPIMAAGPVVAGSVRFGRSRPSRHNPSAPDHLFDRFGR